MAVEHTRVAQAYQACKAVYKAISLPVPLFNLCVDGFIWERPRKQVTAEKLKMLLESLTVGCLPDLENSVRRLLEQPDPKQKRLKTTDLYPIRGRVSDKQVFKVNTPRAGHHLRGDHRMGAVSRNLEFTYRQPQWKTLNIEEARQMALAGESLLVCGLAGVGKSHFIRDLVAELEEKGRRVVTIAKTHNAALVAGGDTADHFAWKHIREGGTGTDVIWVDEVSMLDIQLLQDLNHASLSGPPIQWILSGDFNQYQPFLTHA